MLGILKFFKGNDHPMFNKPVEEIYKRYKLYLCLDHIHGNVYEKLWETSVIESCCICHKRCKVVTIQQIADTIAPVIFQRYKYSQELNAWQEWQDVNIFQSNSVNAFSINDILAYYNISLDATIIPDFENSLKELYLQKNPKMPKNVMTIQDWESFANMVRNKRRFTFAYMREEYGNKYSSFPSANVLDRLGNLVKKADEIEIYLYPQTPLYRARSLNAKQRKEIYSFNDITCPPNQYSKQCRMSPAGVSMFYASFHEATAEKECFKEDEGQIIIGVFRLKKALRVLDLTQISHLSIFHPDYEINEFLFDFQKDITKPISEEDKDINYVPSQVVTEYFRWIYRNKHDLNIHGIIYRSVKDNDKNVVLFFDHEESCQYVELDNLRVVENNGFNSDRTGVSR